MELSVVIPVFESADWLPELLDRLLSTLDAVRLDGYEIVFIDDGSRDNSWEVIRRLQEQHPERIVAVQLMRNAGQHNALMCGLRHAQGQWVVTMDDDLQHPPEEVPKLIEAIRDGDLDLVYGQYEQKKQAGWRNSLGTPVFALMRSVFETDVSFTSFRILRRELVDAATANTNSSIAVDGLLARCTSRIGAKSVRHAPRVGGTSTYSFTRLVRLMLNVFTNFSLLPLQLAWIAGFKTLIIGVLLLFYCLIAWPLGLGIWKPLPTITVVLLVGGVQLLSIGMLGEYVGRILMDMNRRSQYTERQVIGRRPSG